MIEFRDFAPRILTNAGDYIPQFESLEQSVREANDWINTQRIDVLNVETVVLPSFSSRIQGNPEDAYTYVNLGNYWFGCRQFVRVWYRAEA